MSKIFDKKKRKARKMARLEAKLEEGRDTLTPEQQRVLDDWHNTGSTDHEDYDMGDYEKSYK